MSDREALLSKIEEYKHALSQDPKSKVFVALSEAYLKTGQLDDALEVALRGSWELPELAAGYVAVGRVYTQKKVAAKAEASFFKALSVDQMCIPAYKGLARIYKEGGDIQKASDTLTKAIMLDPADQSLQKMIQSLATGTVETGAIESTTDASMQSESQPVDNQEHAMDNPSDGMTPITTATIADIYIEQGLYDKALEVYRELLVDNPQDISVQQKISELEALMSREVNSSTPVFEAEPMAASEAASSDSVVSSASNDTVIGKLNGWLEVIQARRKRV